MGIDWKYGWKAIFRKLNSQEVALILCANLMELFGLLISLILIVLIQNLVMG